MMAMVSPMEKRLSLDKNETTDTDGDGIGDNADDDDEWDGVSDEEDLSPSIK